MKLGRWLCGHEDTARPKRINSWYCSWLKFCADSYFVTFFAGFEKFDNVLSDMKWCMISTYFNQQAPRRVFHAWQGATGQALLTVGFLVSKKSHGRIQDLLSLCCGSGGPAAQPKLWIRSQCSTSNNFWESPCIFILMFEA